MASRVGSSKRRCPAVRLGRWAVPPRSRCPAGRPSDQPAGASRPARKQASRPAGQSAGKPPAGGGGAGTFRSGDDMIPPPRGGDISTPPAVLIYLSFGGIISSPPRKVPDPHPPAGRLVGWPACRLAGRLAYGLAGPSRLAGRPVGRPTATLHTVPAGQTKLAGWLSGWP